MMDASGLKVILVPVLFLALPVTTSGAFGTPRAYSCSQVDDAVSPLRGRQISNSSFSESAFTQLTPTPCRPPETLYEFESNFPPACSLVITTCAAETPSSS